MNYSVQHHFYESLHLCCKSKLFLLRVKMALKLLAKVECLLHNDAISNKNVSISQPILFFLLFLLKIPYIIYSDQFPPPQPLPDPICSPIQIQALQKTGKQKTNKKVGPERKLKTKEKLKKYKHTHTEIQTQNQKS